MIIKRPIMKRIRRQTGPTFLLAGLIGLSVAFTAVAAEKTEKGVYEYVVRKCTIDIGGATEALVKGIQESSFRLIAQYDQAGPGNCSFRARVFIVHEPGYAKKILSLNPLTGPFAIVDRINLFEDEEGLHAAIVNPEGINRTVLMDDRENPDTSSHRDALRQLVRSAIPGEMSEKPFGPIRGKGYINRTMGVMAGGPFNEKIQTVFVGGGKSLAERAGQIEAELKKKGGKWQLGHVCTLILEDEGVAVIGVSSPSVESRSFSIVKAGGDSSRDGLQCPGVAHAGAYPIEIVISMRGAVSYIRILDTMYRMKMYFEDAGKIAFAKNMGMPGSIERSIRDIILNACKQN